MSINHKHFSRLLKRAEEIGSQAGIPAIIARVYLERLKGPAAAYLTADAALTAAHGESKKEGTEAKGAIAAIDKPYGVARAAALAYQPHLVLPESLKAAPTDTDTMESIETLVEVLEANANQGWAKEMLDGEFGKLAPTTVKEIDETIQANATLAAARAARAKAYGPAYDEYLSFKRVVRAACGSTSREYHRIHLRSVDGSQAEEPVAPSEPEVPSDPTL